MFPNSNPQNEPLNPGVNPEPAAPSSQPPVQPIQPPQPVQLAGDNLPPAPEQAPAPTPKKTNIALILAIVEGVIIIALAVILVISSLNSNKDDDSTSGSTEKPTTSNTGITETLQKNQREDARKRDVSIVVQAAVNYVANQNAQIEPGVVYDGTPLKTTGKVGLADYLHELSGNIDYVDVVDFDSDEMTFDDTAPIEPQSTPPSGGKIGNPYINTIVVYTGARCDSNTGIKKAAARSTAIAVQVETGGNGKYYCQDAN